MHEMHKQQGLTLIEVMVSAAILAVLALALLSSTIPLTDASREQAIALDMDRHAGKLFAELRREVRQSGMQANGQDHLFLPVVNNAWGTLLRFEMRIGPDQDDWVTGVTYGTSTSNPAVFSGTPTTIPRLKVWRGQNVLTNDLIDEVKLLQFRRPAAGTLEVELTLLRPAPKWTGTTAPAPIERIYRDTIHIMNRRD